MYTSSEKPKTALVTGATDGIGLAAARALASQGFRVLLHGRDYKKGRAVLEEIHSATGNENLEFFQADFSSLAQVRALAAEIINRHDRLDVLVNNAGVLLPRREVTADGLETMFEVNYLSAFLLTNLLLDLLKSGAPARVVSVSSGMHVSGRLDWDNLQGQKQFDRNGQYSLTKLCLVMFTYALARRTARNSVTANALNPGVVGTKMLRQGWGMGGSSPEEGARTLVYLAASPQAQGVTGQYFRDQRPEQSAPISYNEEAQEQLWQVSADLAEWVE